ncbi:MAG TPA: biosynthetic-type acetolactate synthase large subunit [Chloroflexia bacterium]|jgi:acetolactate synthase-1/2/3 large subunit|nr:biosynthetic-type acetolactate synthase large subunit [Chloroflexia bacterium]
MTEKRTGAQIMCEALIREGVEVMFGIPGGAIMPFYHAMWEYRDQLRHVLCRHEQGAGHAAEGYARSTGKVGVCIGTSGPGTTNLVTPIADAWMDSTPLVAITGQVSSAVLGKDAFQETDITGITMPVTKHNYLVTRAEDLPYVFREAFHIASTGRPGPVLIDITKDAQQAQVVPNWDVTLDLPGYKPTYQGNRKQIREAIKLLMAAQKPLIMAGNGVIMAEACGELRAMAERTGIPVVTTLHGLGSFPEDHPLSIGMPGMHGWVHVNRAIQQCDVLFNIGGRFDDRVTGKASTFAPHAKVIHVDIDPSEIGKNVKVAVPIVGDARLVLQALLEDLPERHACEWLAQIRAMQAEHQHRQLYLNRPDTSQLMPHDVYAAMTRILNERGNYRVVTDVGQHQMWAAQLIDWHRPRTHITSGGAGTMGFGLPAALGVALAHPDEIVWAIVGDGGFQMTLQELATVKQEGITNLKVAIINNGYLGMVRQWQELFENKRYSGTPLTSPDFARLAEAYYLSGMTVERVADVADAIAWACDYEGAVVLDFRVEREVNVFPMVPVNKSIGEMMTEAPQPVAV